jgi:hypothetical protein
MGLAQISRQNAGPAQPQVCQRTNQFVLDHSGVIEDFLELGRSG